MEKKINQDKQEVKKEEKKQETKQEEKIAIVREKNLPISTKHAVALCRFSKGKNPKHLLKLLDAVIQKKFAIPMKGEIPHRKKGKQGRFPVKASIYFKKALKNLIGNANIKGMDVENSYIFVAKADKAARPIKPSRIAFGRKRFKRSHIMLQLKEREIKNLRIERQDKQEVKKEEKKQETKQEEKK